MAVYAEYGDGDEAKYIIRKRDLNLLFTTSAALQVLILHLNEYFTQLEAEEQLINTIPSVKQAYEKYKFVTELAANGTEHPDLL